MTAEPEPTETKSEFTIGGREHRLSLNPRLNRDFFGIRPTISNRISLREDWFRDQKNARINANIRFGLSMRPRVWFGWLFRDANVETIGDGINRPNREDDSSNRTAKAKVLKEKGQETLDSFEEEIQLEEKRQRELDRLERMDVDMEMLEEAESQRGDWISRDKAELERKLKERQGKQGDGQFGLLRRSMESLALNADVSFDTQDSLQRLAPGTSIRDILELPADTPERSQSRQRNRYGFRTSVDPWSWMSLGTNVSRGKGFTKSLSTSSDNLTISYEGNIKLIVASSSLQLRYRHTQRDQSNINTTINESVSQEPSVSWTQSLGASTRAALGVRMTMRDQVRGGGIDSSALIITPNLSIDYKLRLEGGLPIPILGRIPLKHDLDLTNTLSTVIRRENYGKNREERSERYETTLRTRYNLSTRLTANLNLGLSYNNDHVEEGRDFLSIASSVTVRGEFQ